MWDKIYSNWIKLVWNKHTTNWIGIGPPTEQNPSSNTWSGCFIGICAIMTVVMASMALVWIAPFIICCLAGWFGGKAIAGGIRWWFTGSFFR